MGRASAGNVSAHAHRQFALPCRRRHSRASGWRGGRREFAPEMVGSGGGRTDGGTGGGEISGVEKVAGEVWEENVSGTNDRRVGQASRLPSPRLGAGKSKEYLSPTASAQAGETPALRLTFYGDDFTGSTDAL